MAPNNAEPATAGNMERILRLMAEKHASDLYLSSGSPALVKIHGECIPVNNQILPPEGPLKLLSEIMSAEHINELKSTSELNVAWSLPGIGRFRISAMRQRGTVAVVIRYILNDIPPLSSLKLPDILPTLILEKRGLILMVGATGAGKSTTLAAMIDHRNETLSGHILTIEDPIEFLFKSKRSVVNQREVGVDTSTAEIALKNALRQAPDVILIGEIRDRATMSAAIAYAQTGHLCLATMHANNSYQALNRILSFYPVEVRPAMLSDLAAALKAIISQRLLKTVTKQRVAAVEILTNTRLVSDLIEKGEFAEIAEAMEKSMAEGSQTFEADIARLITEGLVDRKEGVAHADSPTNLLWRLQNQVAAAKKAQDQEPQEDPDDHPTFTEITLDVNH